MRRHRCVVGALLLGVSSSLAAHDLFLKLADYRVRPNALVRITALNGTFTSSSNSLARARIADLSLAGPAGRVHLDTTQLSAVGTRTVIRAQTGAEGTYVLGLSTHPSRITLNGEQFNGYLREEGLGTVLESRRSAGELAKGATEQYAKHVKAIFQAGASRSDDYGTALGYPVEIVPLRNPYALRRGDTLEVRLLVNGAPAAGIEALAGGRTVAGARLPSQRLHANADGIARVVLSAPGIWYVKFISMTRATEANLDYLSQWATLTFALLPANRKAE
jgi:hypothetical protein